MNRYTFPIDQPVGTTINLNSDAKEMTISYSLTNGPFGPRRQYQISLNGGDDELTVRTLVEVEHLLLHYFGDTRHDSASCALCKSFTLATGEKGETPNA